MTKLKVDNEFKSICNQILQENKSEDEWALIESSDMFQTGKYNGGFDSTEGEFTFSYYNNDLEYWFQLPLNDIKKISNGILLELEIRKNDN